MHWRRFACLVLGAMLAFSALSGFILWSTPRLSASLAADSLAPLKGTGASPPAAVVQYAAAEQARYFVAKLEWFDMAAGLALTLALLVGTHIHRVAGIVAACMILSTVFLHFVVGPEIAFLAGAGIREAGAEVRLLALQGTYFVVLAAKMLMGAGLAIYLLMVKTRLRPVPFSDVDVVDHSDHRHINRRL